MPRGMLTSEDGPVVVGERTLGALLAIRKGKLLPLLFPERSILIARPAAEPLSAVMPEAPPWLEVVEDRPEQALPERVQGLPESDRATLRVALSERASLVLLEEPGKERAKLSFIRSEGALSLLVDAYREGELSAVRPMVKALEKLGHGDVLPEREQLDALWRALEEL